METVLSLIPYSAYDRSKRRRKYLSIAAASVLAKTYRDDYMNELALEYPAYHWLDNKGYPTKVHREAIRTHGITPYHRKTFTLLPEQLTLGF